MAETIVHYFSCLKKTHTMTFGKKKKKAQMFKYYCTNSTYQDDHY